MNYLYLEWSDKVATNFHDKVVKTLKLLMLMPEMGRFNNELNYHHIFITKQITMFYRVESDHIKIVGSVILEQLSKTYIIISSSFSVPLNTFLLQLKRIY
ncbi:MAG: type II toxin-antitoxin system RelE/ParE family toxin [Bacteroidales bacterium]